MKNLPEDELFDALENRLRNYNEEPDDDVWRAISPSISASHVPEWVLWSNRFVAVIALAALIFLVDKIYQEPNHSAELLVTEQTKEQTSPDSETRTEILQNTTEMPVMDKEAVLNLSIPTDRDASISHQNSGSTEGSSLHLTVIPDSEEWVAGDTFVQSDFPEKPLNETLEDSLQVVRPGKKDTLAHPIPRGTAQAGRKSRSSLSFYTMITPLLSYHRVSPLSNDDVVIEKLNSPSILSASRLGVSMEIGIQGKITNRFEYVAGISYYQQSQRISYEQQTSSNVTIEEDTDKSYFVRPGTLQKSFDYNMRNIGVQTGLLYSLKEDGLIHKTGFVISYQKGLGKSLDTEVYNNSLSHYLSYQLIYRVEYRLKSGMRFFIQPTYMQSLYSKESINAPFSLKQGRAGIGIGAVYSF
jgi:hypothetical protein